MSASPTSAWRPTWLWTAAVLLLFGLPLFIGLHRQDFDNDESIYSFSVDTMVKSGDWMTPKLIPSETQPFLEKPPLKFWIVGVPIKLGWLPADEFGMRFWDALIGGVAFLYIYLIGRRLAGNACGVAAVLILFAHGPLVLEHGLRTNNMEAALFLTYAGGIYHFLAWRSSGPDARGHVIAMALYFVLGFMTKDVAALFLPLVLFLTVLLKREERVRVYFHRWSFAIAAALAFALIAPWFVYEYRLFGTKLFATMFGEHVMKRFTAYLDPAHLQPWHFYFTHMWSQLRQEGVAWLAAAGALTIVWRTARHRWLEGALLILWFAVPMVLISAGTSKLYHYAYPFLPPVALSAGYLAARIVAWIVGVAERVATRRLVGVLVGAAVSAAFVVVALPVKGYSRTIDAFQRDRHPLQDLRACLSPIAARATSDRFGTPGVWVEGLGFTHQYAYYLYRLGNWQQRDVASDATVAMHLFASDDYKPVILGADRYRDFTAHLGRDADAVIRAAARHTDLAPEALTEIFRGSTIGIVPLESATLLLPGPYSDCASEHLKMSSR